MINAPAGPKVIMRNGIVVGELISTGNDEHDLVAVQEFLFANGLSSSASLFDAMVSQAAAFANAAAQLYEEGLKSKPRNGFSAAPFVVNAAFSIDLYLKAIAHKHGKSLHGHELVKLYEALPVEAHVEINTVVPLCADRRALGEKPNLPAYIVHLNKSFVEWRYNYESERTGLVYVEATIFTIEVLHEACRPRPVA